MSVAGEWYGDVTDRHTGVDPRVRESVRGSHSRVETLGGLALQFETTAVVFWSVLLLSLGVLSSLVAARRVLRIDPIEATTGQGVGS